MLRKNHHYWLLSTKANRPIRRTCGNLSHYVRNILEIESVMILIMSEKFDTEATIVTKPNNYTYRCGAAIVLVTSCLRYFRFFRVNTAFSAERDDTAPAPCRKMRKSAARTS